MSRKVETDFEFDKDKFAKLLQKAKGELMLKSFAEKCDVSVVICANVLMQNLIIL